MTQPKRADQRLDMTDSSAPSPDTILGNYRLPDNPLYLVGIFARGVTVYSQQIRAFNLIWALVKKGVDGDITIFEHRDTLLPLQHGSDTRWLHPRIYNWPADDSESAVADLPLLNWTAARASDVAAQILLEWSELVKLKQEQL